jgi:ribonucleoside-diphosphate reductase alpha chain
LRGAATVIVMTTHCLREVLDVVPVTRFTDPAAVDAWDAWFRWREGHSLRDMTVDDTWWRVAESVVGVESIEAPLWSHRFVDAFSHWRLLPDERLLQAAGTDVPLDDFPAPTAALNIAAFVVVVPGMQPRLALSRVVETAALAVRLLDDAIATFGTSPCTSGLRIGVIGMADALELLGIPYASVEAQHQARVLARAVAEGCLRGAIDLADERGEREEQVDRRHLAARWLARNMPPGLIQDGMRIGVRHGMLTAIDPHPRLALLANNVADALDPPAAPVAPQAISDDVANARDHASRAIRSAMQPWIDAPIEQSPRPVVSSRIDRGTAIEGRGWS